MLLDRGTRAARTRGGGGSKEEPGLLKDKQPDPSGMKHQQPGEGETGVPGLLIVQKESKEEQSLDAQNNKVL